MKEAKQGCGGIAAFFDLDGTLVARPSLEWRFFRALRCRRAIRAKNYFLWLREVVRLAPRGICAIRYANKMYLRGVPPGAVERKAEGICFLAEAIDRVAWHVGQGHKIVIVSGTLEMLAREAAKSLESELEARELSAEIQVCATRLEEREGKWTGRIVGEAMYGEAKADALRKMKKEADLDLNECYAYGDSAMDRWMLVAAGRPVAVNPSRRLLRIARWRNWPVMVWQKRRGEESAQSSQRKIGERKVVRLEIGG